MSPVLLTVWKWGQYSWCHLTLVTSSGDTIQLQTNCKQRSVFNKWGFHPIFTALKIKPSVIPNKGTLSEGYVKILVCPLTEYLVNRIMRCEQEVEETYLRHKFRVKSLESLQGLQEEGRFSETQEARYVGRCQGHHLTVLVENLEKHKSHLILNSLSSRQSAVLNASI